MVYIDPTTQPDSKYGSAGNSDETPVDAMVGWFGEELSTFFNILPNVAKWLGFPYWIQHPLLAAEDEISYLVGEAEYYSALPASILVGGVAIYYLRKGRRTPALS